MGKLRYTKDDLERISRFTNACVDVVRKSDTGHEKAVLAAQKSFHDTLKGIALMEEFRPGTRAGIDAQSLLPQFDSVFLLRQDQTAIESQMISLYEQINAYLDHAVPESTAESIRETLATRKERDKKSLKSATRVQGFFYDLNVLAQEIIDQHIVYGVDTSVPLSLQSVKAQVEPLEKLVQGARYYSGLSSLSLPSGTSVRGMSVTREDEMAGQNEYRYIIKFDDFSLPQKEAITQGVANVHVYRRYEISMITRESWARVRPDLRSDDKHFGGFFEELQSYFGVSAHNMFSYLCSATNMQPESVSMVQIGPLGFQTESNLGLQFQYHHTKRTDHSMQHRAKYWGTKKQIPIVDPTLIHAVHVDDNQILHWYENLSGEMLKDAQDKPVTPEGGFLK